MLDARRLKVLVEVSKRGSLSGAAEALGYTQPAISRQISTLEAETGATLLRRVPQGAVLTDAGRLLVQRAKVILAQLDDAELELQALLGLRGGRLRMASFASAAASVVPAAVIQFRTGYPNVELSISMSDPIDSLPRLQSGELDLALSHDPLWAIERGDLQLIHLFDDPIYVALPLSHPLAAVEPLPLRAFAEESWMIGTPETCPDSRLFRRACAEAGFEPRIQLEHDDYGAVLGFVAAGLGVALIPEMVTRVVREDVVLRALDPPPPPRPIMVALPADYRSPAATAMVGVLQQVAAQWVADRAAAPGIAALR